MKLLKDRRTQVSLPVTSAKAARHIGCERVIPPVATAWGLCFGPVRVVHREKLSRDYGQA